MLFRSFNDPEVDMRDLCTEFFRVIELRSAASGTLTVPSSLVGLSWSCDSHDRRYSAVAENGAGGCVFRLAGDECGVDGSVLMEARVRTG